MVSCTFMPRVQVSVNTFVVRYMKKFIATDHIGVYGVQEGFRTERGDTVKA